MKRLEAFNEWVVSEQAMLKYFLAKHGGVVIWGEEFGWDFEVMAEILEYGWKWQ